MPTDPQHPDIPMAVPVTEPKRQRTCPHCGSSDIAKGLVLHQRMDIHPIGVMYHSGGKFLGVQGIGQEPLLLDLCEECGTVTRFYVRDTDRDWARQ